jgi:bacteriorhodopsin
MNSYARAFRVTVWIGVLVNFSLALAAIFAPDWLLRTMGFDVAYPNIWPRFAGWLLILLSLFYIPGANDPTRYRANAVLSVCARFAGVAFFTGAVLLVGFSTRYLLFGLIDLVFAVPTAVLLWLAIRRLGSDRAREQQLRASLLPTAGASHVESTDEVAPTR